MNNQIKNLVKIFIPAIILTLNLGTLWYFNGKSTHFFSVAFLITGSFAYFLFQKRKVEKNFSALLKKSQKFTQDLSGTGEQILGSCSQINDSVSSQSSAVVETSTASDEISVMIKRNTDNIDSVSEFIKSIGSLVDKSSVSNNKLKTNLNNGMLTNEKVADLLSETTKSLEELISQFSEVVQKTGIINDIVFQTKLLSFNASVEAARAGEHGKGFSVVAEEIGNLATMSGDSATDIKETLEVTQIKVQEIIGLIKQNKESLSNMLLEQTRETKVILGDFNQHFSNVKTDVEKIISEIDSVKVASKEQEKGVLEMRDGIHNVNHSVQKNTLVIGQTDSLANVLNTEIENFKNLLSNFQNKNNKTQLKIELIPWDDKYRIGIDNMDHEHIVLLDKINALITDMNENSKNVKTSFTELKNYTITHFTHEEEYMRTFKYSSYESHKQVHKNLLSVILAFEKNLDQGSLDNAKLASFLKNWLFTHIMGVDTKYAKEAKDKNLKLVA